MRSCISASTAISGGAPEADAASHVGVRGDGRTGIRRDRRPQASAHNRRNNGDLVAPCAINSTSPANSSRHSTPNSRSEPPCRNLSQFIACSESGISRIIRLVRMRTTRQSCTRHGNSRSVCSRQIPPCSELLFSHRQISRRKTRGRSISWNPRACRTPDRNSSVTEHSEPCWDFLIAGRLSPSG
jgi:hypothetical protein